MLQPLLPKLLEQRIVLASGSPRRQEILKRIGLKFEVVPSKFEENLKKSSFAGPHEYATATARGKALEVADRLYNQVKKPDLIIGADTVVSLGSDIIEKPADEDDAFRILKRLNAKKHEVVTGVVLVVPSLTDTGTEKYDTVEFHESTEVCFGDLTDEMLKAYVATGEPMDKAGGYGIQAIGSSLVQGIHGDYFNVEGFPVYHFCKKLVQVYRERQQSSAPRTDQHS
ncbi:probable bifunctional dTTP/UTP pyrophosphatase/methyltransferase protein isoform X1 [Branchiostoma lanceolatum]|uniref:probable bifunctional dTTP/UTP pyrophosphatase/methyltransferase protein isoform X1 n=1 Tax=Branchiostoma lanceolatum TaxID=7740 RepID=UPI0034554AAF